VEFATGGVSRERADVLVFHNLKGNAALRGRVSEFGYFDQQKFLILRVTNQMCLISLPPQRNLHEKGVVTGVI
jgi:hypothetical protein